MLRPWLTAIALAAACACTPQRTPAPSWRVENGFIRDPQGRAVILRGANVSGRNKAPPFFDFHGPDDWRRMRVDWGMNAVRFLVVWDAIEPARDQSDAAYLDAVAERVQQASDAGLLVFVDMHQDLYGPGFGGDGAPRWTCPDSNYASFTPRTPWFFGYLAPEVIACFDGFWSSRDLQERYVRAWTAVATRLRGIDGFVGFDPMNEPYWGSAGLDIFEERRLAPLYREIITAVRAQKPDALAFLEPAASRNLGVDSRLPVFTEPNVVYTPHSYDGDAEQGKGFDATHRQALLDNTTALQAEATTLGAALVIGEYGGMTNTPGIGDYMDAQFVATGAHAAGALYWHYGRDDGYGLLASDGSEKTALLDAVARPYPERVAGEPVDFAFDPAASVFTFHYRPARTVTSPTRIAIPARTWPGGFSVACDCRFHTDEGGLVIDAPAAGDVVEVRITPR